MNKLETALKKKDLLSIYYTAGYPTIENTTAIRTHLAKAGADMVEIGIPFSDPVADGTVIQEANQKAINNGMDIRLLMQQLEECTSEIAIPTILMGYLNPVMQYGIEAFLQQCQNTKIAGIILPDLPVDLYAESYQPLFEKYAVPLIPIITPSTSDERLKQIHKVARSFIYLVSSSTTTGEAIKRNDNQLEEFQKKYNRLGLTLPVLIGFGIRDKKDFQHVCKYGQGGIIGSEFIRYLNQEKNVEKACHQFVKKIKEI